MKLRPCGLYRTRSAIGSVPAGKLVYFHSHGEPGAGIYLPERWQGNRMQPSSQGTPFAADESTEALEALPPEGFYHTLSPFHCCEKQCRKFEAEMLVQLGYNRDAKPILFVPELVDGMMAIPERGTTIDEENLGLIRFLRVKVSQSAAAH